MQGARWLELSWHRLKEGKILCERWRLCCGCLLFLLITCCVTRATWKEKGGKKAIFLFVSLHLFVECDWNELVGITLNGEEVVWYKPSFKSIADDRAKGGVCSQPELPCLGNQEEVSYVSHSSVPFCGTLSLVLLSMTALTGFGWWTWEGACPPKCCFK